MGRPKMGFWPWLGPRWTGEPGEDALPLHGLGLLLLKMRAVASIIPRLVLLLRL